MRILVMGGSRFIGRHVLNKLTGYEVTVVNRGRVEEETYLPEGMTALALDRNSPEEMTAALGDRMFDLLLDISCITERHATILLDVLGGRIGRHVHVSTGSVYDESLVPEHVPVDEDFPIGPIDETQHPYMNDKRGAEKVLMERTPDNLAIVRPTFVYGPHNYIYREAYFFDRISRGRTILIPLEGGQDLVHAEDLAEMVVQLGLRPEIRGAFNGSTGKIVTGQMLAHDVGRALGKEPKIRTFTLEDLREIGWPEDFPLYPYIPRGIMAFSDEKIRRTLGFAHRYSYVEGLKDAYRWWSRQDNPEPDWEAEDLLIEFLHAEPHRRQEIKQDLQGVIGRIREELRLRNEEKRVAEDETMRKNRARMPWA